MLTIARSKRHEKERLDKYLILYKADFHSHSRTYPFSHQAFDLAFEAFALLKVRTQD